MSVISQWQVNLYILYGYFHQWSQTSGTHCVLKGSWQEDWKTKKITLTFKQNFPGQITRGGRSSFKLQETPGQQASL